jgi:starch phosphorylase
MPLYIHRSGEFGWEDFLEPVVHNITDGGDFYLVANDFVPYLEAQVKRQKRGD